MQEFLNIFLYFVCAIYAVAFVYQGYINIDKNKKSLNQKTDYKTTETTLLVTVKENLHHVNKVQQPIAKNPALAEYNKVTVNQMRDFIKNQELKPRLEQIMNLKLYKARKQDLYKALQKI